MSELTPVNLDMLEKMEMVQGYKIHIKGYEEFYLYKFSEEETTIFVMQDETKELYQIEEATYHELLQMSNFDEIEKKSKEDEE